MIKRMVVVAVAILVFAAAFVLRESPERAPGPEMSARMTEQVQTALPRLVDLGSDRCIPCKKMAPILAELAEEHRGSLVVEVLDVWKDPDLGQSWGVRVIPTQIFIDASGEERFRHEGFMAKDAILEKWRDLGVEITPRAAQQES